MILAEVRKLATLYHDKNIGLSLYLNIDAKELRRSEIKTTLNHLIDEEFKNANLNHEQRKALRSDIDNIRSFVDFDLIQGKNRGLALFSKSAINLFKAIYLPQPIEDRILFGSNFLLRPLAGFLDDYSEYLAVLVDQSRGMFFEVEHGETVDYYYFRDEVPSKVKEGGIHGYDERHIEKHIDEHILRHFQKVAKKTFDFLKKYNYKRLFLVGQAETLSKFKKTLYSYAKRKVAAEIEINLTKESSDIIMAKIFQIIEEIKNKDHQNISYELEDKYPHQAVLGLDKVNLELDRNRVQKLLLSRNFRRVYPVCDSCNYLIHDQLICPKCNTDLSLLDYETNQTTIKALLQNSEIHFLEDDKFDKQGGIGAILR